MNGGQIKPVNSSLLEVLVYPEVNVDTQKAYQ